MVILGGWVFLMSEVPLYPEAGVSHATPETGPAHHVYVRAVCTNTEVPRS